MDKFFDTFYIQWIFYYNLCKVREVLLNIDYFIADPRTKGLSAFIYIKSNNLDEELKQ